MSDSKSDEEGELPKKPFSWTPPYHLSTFPLFLSESGRLSFLVIDDPISKQRIEKILKDYGGKICRNVVYSWSVVLVSEDKKPLPHWGPVYSRRWVRDSVAACSLKELNKYLIKGCIKPNVKKYEGSLTSSLFFEKFEFRQSPLTATFFSKDLFSRDETSPDSDVEILVTCKICRNVERLENGESPVANRSVTKCDEAKVVSTTTAPVSCAHNKIHGVSDNPVSSSSDHLLQNKTLIENPLGKELTANVDRGKKIRKRKLTNLEDLINVSECAVRLERVVDSPLDRSIHTNCERGLMSSDKQNNPTSLNSEQIAQQPPTNETGTNIKGQRTDESDNKCSSNSVERHTVCVPGSSKDAKNSSKPSYPVHSDSDSDSCINDLRKLDQLKKFSVENKHTKTKFARAEKIAILKFIVNRRAYHRLKSDALYREMEERNICPRRTYQSMKNHFLKTLINELDNFEFLTDNVKQKIRGESNHVY